MKDKAIAKLTDEAMKINDPVAFAIEEHLTSLCTTDKAAALLLAEDKSLKTAYDLVWSEAKKRIKGNCAYIPPEEVFTMVDRYYGLDQIGSKAQKARHADKVNVLDLF